MKKIAFFLCTILLAANVHAYDDDSNYTGNFNLFFGNKSLDSDEWEPMDSHFEYGILFDLKQEGWPISLTADILHSSDKTDYLGVDVKGSTTEFDLGITKHWQTSSVTPYVGGGIAIINAEIEVASVELDGTGVGIWGKAGAFFTADDGTNIGFELRYSQADAELEYNGASGDIKAGGLHAGIFIGYHW